MSTAKRRVDASAVAAILPLLALVPLWLVSLAVFWLPIRLVWSVSFTSLAVGYLAASLLLFWRPFQVFVLAPLIGARRPTREQRSRLETAWRSVLQANRLPRKRYVVVVLPSNDLNAYACGGHLVVVTSYAVASLPRDELAGVLAHELSHHLGLHTVALTVAQWLSVPILTLARLGFFLQNVATAATRSFASGSSAATSLGRLVSGVLTSLSWMLLSGLLLSNAIGNAVGRNAEFQADERAVVMGFGSPLAMALRRVAQGGSGQRPLTWRDRVAATHPPARTRVARIEAQLRTRR
jgi:Zn-dependent protease with chaperone function